MVNQQGFSLLDDGLWLLGTREILSGKVLYRDLFSIYGPMRYWLLAPLFTVAGQKILALAFLKALSDASLAAVGFHSMRKRGYRELAWLVPIGVIAVSPSLPRYTLAAVVALVLSSSLMASVAGMRGLLVGGLCGLLSLFGVDGTIYSAGIAGAYLIRVRLQREDPDGFQRFTLQAVMGFLAVLGLVWLHPVVHGYAGTTWWDTVVYPLAKFRNEMGLSWLAAISDTDQLGRVFYGVGTNEALPPVAGWHVGLRVWILRLLYTSLFCVPVLAVWRVYVEKKFEWLPVVAFATTGLMTVAVRSDEAHLKAAWIGSILLLPLLLHGIRAKRFVRDLAAIALSLLLFGVLAGEHLWLVFHANRPTLARWERSTAGNLMNPEYTQHMDGLLERIEQTDSPAVVAWPAQPGINFLLDVPIGTSQATLLAGELKDSARVVSEVEANAVDLVVLGNASGLIPGIRTFDRLAPEIWRYLSNNYLVEDQMSFFGDDYQILTGLKRGRLNLLDQPLVKRLPAAGQYVKVAMTPTLSDRVSVGQTVRLGDRDLSGLSLIVETPPPYPAEVALVISIGLHTPESGSVDRLGERHFTRTITQPSRRSYFRFDPVPGTAGRVVYIEIRADSASRNPMRLVWTGSGDSTDSREDWYPEGNAYLNGKPLNCDLFFIVW